MRPWRRLTVGALLHRPLGACRLCVLSACSTALSDFSDSEAVGLPAVLLTYDYYDLAEKSAVAALAMPILDPS